MRLPSLPSKEVLEAGIRELMGRPVNEAEETHGRKFMTGLYSVVHGLPEAELDRLDDNLDVSYVASDSGLNGYIFGIATGMAIAMLAAEEGKVGVGDGI